jgi:flagellar biosynthetic protein FliQ
MHCLGDSEGGVSGPEVLDIARDAIWTIMLLGWPVMMAGLVVGVVIGLLQAVTQIQEATLVFVPKVIAIFLVLLLSLPYMGSVMNGYMNRLVERMIAGG